MSQLKSKICSLFNLLPILLLTLPTNLYAQNNPCASPNAVVSVAVNISTAVTTRIVNNTSVDKGVVVCGFTLTLGGAATANQVKFQYGTGTTCGTGTTDLSGPFLSSPATTSNSAIVSNASPIFTKLPVATDLCIVTTQAVVVSGVVTYAFY